MNSVMLLPAVVYFLVHLTKNGIVVALICYENADGVAPHPVKNDTWTYCTVLMPTDETDKGSRLYGVGAGIAEVERSALNGVFDLTGRYYNVLTVCFLEEYKWNLMSNARVAPEFMFRCVCRTDGCNRQAEMRDYVNSLQKLTNISGGGS